MSKERFSNKEQQAQQQKANPNSEITVSGIIENIFPTQIFGGGLEIRKIWLNIGTSVLEITFLNADGEKLENFEAGQRVECIVKLTGRKSKKNGAEFVYNTIQGVFISY